MKNPNDPKNGKSNEFTIDKDKSACVPDRPRGSISEKAILLARCKKLYETKFPETKHGGSGRGRPKPRRIVAPGDVGSKEWFAQIADMLSGVSEVDLQSVALRFPAEPVSETFDEEGAR